MTNILIIDDQPDDISGPYMLIHHLGYNASLAFDGGQALPEMKKRHFDLVILDWKMPMVSGKEFLQAIENGALGRRTDDPVRIVIYSGETLSYENFENSRLFRVVDIWAKPFRAADTAKRLKLLIENITKVVA